MNIIETIQKYKKIIKTIKLGHLTYIIFEDNTILVIIQNNDNIFKIYRNEFNIIEEELLDYDFCLIDNSEKQLYYIKIKEPSNFIRKAFDSTVKDEIYFGKEILQNKVTRDEFLEKIKKIGK